MFRLLIQKWIKRSVILLSVIFLLPLLTACTQDETKLVLETDAGQVTINVEIADTPSATQRGLMFRTKMPREDGMLFDFKEDSERFFWMQNTFIPLDMIFIDQTGEIKHIHSNAVPQDTTSIPSKFPVRFVLEINGGLASQYGLKPGDRVMHPRMKPAADD